MLGPAQSPKVIQPLNAQYSQAVTSFLLKHHLSAWSLVFDAVAQTKALLRCPELQLDGMPSWIPHRDSDTHQPSEPSQNHPHGSCPSENPTVHGLAVESQPAQQLHELLRKLQVLRIALLASLDSAQPGPHRPVAGQPDPGALVGAEARAKLLDFLNRSPEQRMLYIWCLESNSSADPSESDTLDQPLASHHLNHLHPAIVTSAALASIKLGVPLVGKAICETWLGSLNDWVVHHLYQTLTEDKEQEPGASASSGSESCRRKLHDDDLRYCYEQLIEVYTVHILCSVNETEFALDFLNAQSTDMGGMMAPSSVQRILGHLEAQQAQRLRMADLALQRQKDRAKKHSIGNGPSSISTQSARDFFKKKKNPTRHSELQSVDTQIGDLYYEESSPTQYAGNQDKSVGLDPGGHVITRLRRGQNEPLTTPNAGWTDDPQCALTPQKVDRRASGFALTRSQLSEFLSNPAPAFVSVSGRPNVGKPQNLKVTLIRWLTDALGLQAHHHHRHKLFGVLVSIITLLASLFLLKQKAGSQNAGFLSKSSLKRQLDWVEWLLRLTLRKVGEMVNMGTRISYI